jgi:hypothetical protein
MMCLFSGMTLSPTWSCNEDIFADAVDYGKMHDRLNEELNSSWVEPPLCPESFGESPAALRQLGLSPSVRMSLRSNLISNRRAAL